MSLLLELCQRLLACPTAAFHEHHAMAAVLDWADEAGLQTRRDEFGNVTLSVGAANDGLCLTAHLDHPAMGFGRPESSRDVLFERLGGVPDALTRDAAVRLHGCDPRRPEPVARGRVSAFLEEGDGRSTAPAFRVRLDEAVDLPEPVFAVWDLPGPQLADRRLQAGACDDLVGVAVALAVLDAVREAGTTGLHVLLTRAEETGFGGLLAALEADALPAAAAWVNIECSSCRAGAPLGDGPVIRVGDRRWVFDGGVTAALEKAAAAVAARDDSFRVQRRLMDGGVCEATPLARSGRPTGAVALPLDNYHNHGGRRLRAEAVHLDDAEQLVALLTELVLRGPAPDAALRDLDDNMETRRRQQAPRLRDSAAGLPQPSTRSL